MRKIVLASLCALIALPLLAAVEGPDSKSILAKHWAVSKQFTIEVANAMPAGDYDFKPNPEEMSFGQVMAHIAQANNAAFARVSGLKAPDIPEVMQKARKDLSTHLDKDLVIKFLTASFEFCEQTLKEITPEQMAKMSGPEGRQLSGHEVLWSYFTHTAHHRGQAEVYLRVKNIKPPAYRF